MNTIFVTGKLPVLTLEQQRNRKAAWRVKDHNAKQKKASAVKIVYASPEYQREMEEREAFLAEVRASRKAAGIEKRKATMAAKRAVRALRKR